MLRSLGGSAMSVRARRGARRSRESPPFRRLRGFPLTGRRAPPQSVQGGVSDPAGGRPPGRMHKLELQLRCCTAAQRTAESGDSALQEAAGFPLDGQACPATIGAGRGL